MYPCIVLKPKKEASVVFGHPWVFSGAIHQVDPTIQHGDFVTVTDFDGKPLGNGSFAQYGSISVRMFGYDANQELNEDWFLQKIRACLRRREMMGYGPKTSTTGYRVCFGEVDGIPGLVVDRFLDVVVFQLSTAALDRRRAMLVRVLTSVFQPRALIERSDVASRKEEQLSDVVLVHAGEDPGAVLYQENGVVLFAYPLEGQKTGAFLDQKLLRAWIKDHTQIFRGMQVLNAFSYTGATGVCAMLAGAQRVVNVDSSEFALAGCQKNAQAHSFSFTNFETHKADAFTFLGSSTQQQYDGVIIDPPALIKTKGDIEEGKKAYHFLNRSAIRLVKPGGVFITSSCSHFLSEEDFLFLLRRASVQCGRRLHMLSHFRQAPDHPESVYFPESIYLKSFCFEVE